MSPPQQVGPGNKFTQTYTSLRRDGVEFRGSSSGGRGGRSRDVRRVEGRYGGKPAASRRVLQPGDKGYDEEVDLAAAIYESSLGLSAEEGGGNSGIGGGGGGAAAGTRQSFDLSFAAGEPLIGWLAD